nr:putative reverse transcriptase domain, aspartic peptidase domain protein [Tanacetum cinerariifolium]
KSGDRHQPTTQQSSHKNHGHNNDRHGSDRRGGSDNHRSSNNNNYSGNNNRLNFKSIQSSSTHKHDPNITKDCKKNTAASTSGQADKKPSFLATIHDTTSDAPSIHDQPIVSDLPDVFPDELPGIPLVREIEFNIELILGAEPISKAPYRMAPIE